jgi:hypothetical protein
MIRSETILAPVDFSDHSKEALETATDILECGPDDHRCGGSLEPSRTM